MLEYIRSSAQSFGVKLAFGIIILVFVFWGIGNFNDRDYSNVVAVVNGEPIVAMEFEKAYQSAEEFMLRNNPGLTREDLVREHLGREVLRDLIQETLLAQEARRTGLTVDPIELRKEVEKIQAFQNDQGKFDPEVYKRVLSAQRMTPAEYEKGLSNQILREKMFTLLTAPVWIDPEEAARMFNFLREKRIVNYYFIPASRFDGQVKIDEKEARAWYDEHPDAFAIPPAVELEYIAVRPEALVKKEELDEGAARAWYEANIKNFVLPERAKASHILVRVAPDADDETFKAALDRIREARKLLDEGVPFATVADSFNTDNAAGPGGELGWISRGETVPPFEDALFALEPGAISEVIRTPFGLHLIYLQEKAEGGQKPFEEAKDAAYAALAFEAGSEKLHDALDTLIEDNILNKPLAESAAKFGLEAVKTQKMDQAALVKELGVSEEGAKSLLETPPNAPLDSALEAGEKYIVARVVAAHPAGVKPFDEVRDEIEKNLKSAKTLELAISEAKDALAKFRDEPFDEAREKNNIITTQPIERGGTIKDFAPDPELNTVIFDTRPGQWAPTAYTEQDEQGPGAMIVRVERVLPPKPEEFAEVEEVMTTSAKQNRKQAMFQFFMNNLGNKAKIEITNQNFIDRVGR
ncbi:MAG: peptidylprolyl isomerase [Desulfovibrio sp.]|nr:peptidylprolyl isomerase [Desulfovibrio sp.]